MPFGTEADPRSQTTSSRPDLRDNYRKLAIPAVVAAILAKKAEPRRSEASGATAEPRTDRSAR